MRLVNAATSQWIASARCSDSACEETSITAATSLPSRIARNVGCRSIASGVVRTTGRSAPPTHDVTVPISPVWRPDASSSARVRYEVVVLPLVPVIPTIASSAVGSPARRAAAGAIAARTSSTSTSGDGQIQRMIDDQRDRAVGDRLGRVAMAVSRKAAHAEEDRTGPDGPRVVGQCGDVDVRERGVREEVAQEHRGDHSRGGRPYFDGGIFR